MHRTPTEGTIKAVNRDTDTEDGVDLHLGDADDKFGFGDGDIFEEWVRAWAHQAWPSHTEGIDLDDPDDHVWPYLDDRRILDHVVTHKLIPRLAPDLAQHISTFGTIHNPIRFDPPDEREDDTEWQQRAVDEMNSISAHVSRSEIYRLCDELYPPRDRSWLALYNELTWQFALMRELREHERTLVSTVGMKITDHTHARLGNEGSLLLAELLSTRGRQIGDEGASLLELDELVRVAAACCR